MKLLLPRYILYYLLSPQGQTLLSEGTASVAQPNINARKIERFPVPLAPETEMTQVLSKIETLFTQAQEIESQIKSASHSIDMSAQSLMNVAFRGELVPRDPTDEPASVALERIRAQRATVTKRGKHRLEEFASPATIAVDLRP
jgi:type I restriction enzyme S subunit